MRFFCGILLLLFACQVHATESDSLARALSRARHDTTRIRLHYRLVVQNAINGNYSACKTHMQDALKLGARCNFPEYKENAYCAAAIYYRDIGQSDSALYYINKGIAQQRYHTNIPVKVLSYRTRSHIYENMGDYDRAFASLRKALSLLPEKRYNHQRALVYGNIGVIQNQIGETDSAIYYFNRQLALFDKSSPAFDIAAGHQNLGTALYYKAQYDDAVRHFLKAKEMYARGGFEHQVFEMNSNLGGIFGQIGQPEKAFSYFYDARNYIEKTESDAYKASLYSMMGVTHEHVNRFDSALYYHQKSLAIHQKLNNDRSCAIDFHNIATVYNSLDQPQEAARYFQQSIALKQKLGIDLSLARSYLGYAIVLRESGKIRESLSYLRMAEPIFLENDANQELIDLYDQFSKLYSASGNYQSAFNYQQKYIALKDSVDESTQSTLINELELKFNTSEKDRLISEQQNTILIERRNALTSKLAALQQRNIIIIIAGAALLIIILLIFAFARLRLKHQKEYAERLALEKENGLQKILTAQEEERKRIGTELHDGLVQEITYIKMNLEELESMADPETRKHIIELTAHADRTVIEARNLSYQMMPLALRELGLTAALEDVFRKMLGSQGIEYAFIYGSSDHRFPDQIEIMLYRIVQELINNIIKHSRASEVKINMRCEKDLISLKVEDNGTGFQHAQVSGGIGMTSLKSRIAIVNGELLFQSAVPSGTIVVIRIPVP